MDAAALPVVVVQRLLLRRLRPARPLRLAAVEAAALLLELALLRELKVDAAALPTERRLVDAAGVAAVVAPHRQPLLLAPFLQPRALRLRAVAAAAPQRLLRPRPAVDSAAAAPRPSAAASLATASG